MLGTAGHLLILFSFVSCLLAGFAFFRAAQERPGVTTDWRRIGRITWGVMTGALIAAGSILLYLIVTHQFQYAYVYQYSSRDLPLDYLLSTFWAGQEGSFLVWMLFTAYMGLALMRWVPRDYEMPVMTVVAGCQAFLISMIVGLQLGPIAIGSSAFDTLAARFPEAPMLQVPGFVPADGNGLNDLLQNPWMVIHPPMLFVGFASMIVPFAFAVAALWKERYTEWVRPAMPWTIFGVATLGVGITLGGYWAYVTLSFGGYWAWDPVENSSLVPWMVGVGAIHAMLVQKKTANGHRAALLLCILSFMLVVYSTFLTRSGILGDISVHSFVDLGLSGQLVVWLGAMAVAGLGLLAWRWNRLPRPEKEPPYLSREFMIFSGAMLLCALGAVILLGTSSPIFGRLFRDNPAAVPVTFYNKWSLPMSVGITFLVALGQLFWWNKMSVAQLNKVVVRPLALAVVSTVAVLVLTPFVEFTRVAVEAPDQTAAIEAGLLGGFGPFWAQYGTGLLMLLLVLMGFFALYGNALVLWRIGRGNLRLAGGAVSHIGFALVILGVVASSGFSNPVGRGGVAMPSATGQSRDNFVLTKGETRVVSPQYAVTYAGREQTAEGHDRFLLTFARPDGSSFDLSPVVYQSDDGQWIQHPDVKMFVEKDIYAAVTPSDMFTQPEEQRGKLDFARGETAEIADGAYRVTFTGYDTNVSRELVPDSGAVAVAAVVEMTHVASGVSRTLRPVYYVTPDGQQQFLQARVPDWNLAVTFLQMNVDNGQVTLGFDGVDVTPEDWIVVQAYEKPFINVLWLGIILLTIGFALSVVRRVQDVRRTPGFGRA